jgi:hypothetical protein
MQLICSVLLEIKGAFDVGLLGWPAPHSCSDPCLITFHCSAARPPGCKSSSLSCIPRHAPPLFFQSQACAALWREELGAMAGDFGGSGGLSRARKCPPRLLLFLSPPKSLAYIWHLPPSVPLPSFLTCAAFVLSDRRSRCGGAAGRQSSSSPVRRSESVWLVLSCSSCQAPWTGGVDSGRSASSSFRSASSSVGSASSVSSRSRSASSPSLLFVSPSIPPR